MVAGEENFMFLMMFWIITAVMFVLLYALKQVISTQRYIKNIDENISRMVLKIEKEERRILDDIENKHFKKLK